jgi:hypothetical protein
MALKQLDHNSPWAAVWKVSSSTVINYSGINLDDRKALITSISTNRGGDNPFESEKRKLSGSQGFCPVPPTLGKFFTIQGPSTFGTYVPGYMSASIPSDADITARTNPSRPMILLPVFLFELRELPDMIRQMGRFLLNAKNWRRYIRDEVSDRDVASAHLAFQFGWMPIISDLLKISKFADAVDKRRREIDRLSKGKGLKRRISLGAGVEKLAPVQVFANFGNYKNFSVTVDTVRQYRAWAVVNWVTNTSTLPTSDSDLHRILLGLTPGNIIQDVWEALPWSWLIDYFTNIGAVLQAGNQTIARPNGGVVMVQYTSVSSHPPAQSSPDVLSAGTLTVQKNTRRVLGSPNLTAGFPTLDSRQLSILGALAITRGRRK